MAKPVYYILRSDFSTDYDYQKAKEKLKKLGYRVVTFLTTDADSDIHGGWIALIRNHSVDSICGLPKGDRL